MRKQQQIRKIKKFTNRMRGKLMFVFFVMILCIFVLIGRLVYLNHTDGERYEKKVLSQQTYTSTVIPYQRGSILDRNGTVLAVSEKVYNVILDVKNMLEDDKYLKPTKKALTESFADITGDVFNELVEKKAESRYSILIKGISYDDMMSFKEKQEKDTNIKGVWFEEDYVRKYPYKSLASSIIGFTSSGNVGNWGIEQFYNEELNGTNGIEFGYMNEELKLERTVNPSINGNTMVSTIDANVQSIVQQHIKGFNEEYGSKNLGILIMNPNNGEIIAMASNEEYDLNNPMDLTPFYTKAEIKAMSEEERLDNLNAIWRNYVISDSYEPGSTFKPFTIAAGLEEDIIQASDTFVCDGIQRINGVPVTCSNKVGHGVINLTQALMLSCNDALMQIGEKEGKSLFLDYQRFFGFGSKTGIDLPGEGNGILFKEDQLGPVDLAINSFGQSFNTTMIQLASGFSSLINGGNYYEPHVVKQILNSSGAVVTNNDKELVRVSVSGETSDFIREAMYLTVEEGTAKGAQVSGYKVGGKTGTAQKLPRAAKTYLVSFIGCVPTDDPEVVIYVVIDEPQNVVKQADSSLATKLASKVLKDVLPFLEIYPTEDTDTDTENTTDAGVTLPSTDSKKGQTTETKEDKNKSGSSTEDDAQNESTQGTNEVTDETENVKNEESSEFNPDSIPDTVESEESETGN